MRISKARVNATLNKQITQVFYQTLSDLKTPKNIEVFLKDFMTDSEIETYTKRLAVVYWLKKGRSYANIKENLKVSSATIASTQESMDKTGIKLALKHIEAEEWANQWAEKISKVLPVGKKKLATK